MAAEDYTACSEQELSLQRGQQVEILDSSPGGSADWCLVRVVDTSPTTEGLVPIAMLKHVPNLKVSSSRGSIDNEGEVSKMSYCVIEALV